MEKTAYLSRGLTDKAFAITKHNTEDIPLQSNLEKSDILHAVIASKNGASKIIVNSPDGDSVC